MELSAMGSMQRSKVKYSPKEEQLIKLLPDKGVSISSAVLVEKLYGINRPYYAEESVSKMMSELIKKVNYNKENFQINKTKPAGPYPIEYAKVDR